MNKPGEKIYFTLFLLLCVTAFFILTLRLGTAARFVPLAVLIPTLGILGVQLLFDISPRLAERMGSNEKKDIFKVRAVQKPRSEERGDEADTEQARHSEREAFLWLFVLLGLLYAFGFLIGLPVYTFLFLKRVSKESWPTALALAFGLFGMMYSVFSLALRVQLYEGLLLSWLGH